MRPFTTALVLAAASLAAPAAVAAPAAQDTAVRVSPATGTAQTTFTVGFTLRVTPSTAGAVATTYRVVTQRIHADRASCHPLPRTVASGSAGDRRHVRLRPPAGGWCLGRYRVTVYLQRGPQCPPPGGGPCPKLASTRAEAGSARFSVRSRPA